MARIRISRRPEVRATFAIVALILITACGSGSSLETATEMPKAQRRPDGVVIEPPAAMPPAQDRAAAVGVVALREPLADKDVEDVVHAYVRAFEREDLDGLKQLLTQDATPLGRAGNRQALLDLFAMRIKNFEYQKLAGSEVARLSQLEKQTYDSLGLPGAIPRPTEMHPGDLYVRVPIAVPRIGSEQLFGDILVLLLRREDGRLKIAAQADENAN